MIEQAIKINSEIAKVGAEGNFGLNIGRHIRQSQESGLMGKDVMLEAVAVTSSAADARMRWWTQIPSLDSPSPRRTA